MANPTLHPLLAPNIKAKHGFFTRKGGVSKGLYESLNCGLGSKDKKSDVEKNRSLVQTHLGAQKLLTCHQHHSKDIWHIKNMEDIGNKPKKADGMITQLTGLALGVLTADCAPLFMHDAASQTIAALHSGWRGSLAGIGEEGLDMMEKLGAKRENIAIAIGPSISQKAYETSEEIREQFLNKDKDAHFFFTKSRKGHYFFALAPYIASRLERAGATTPYIVPACSTDEEWFFSWRRESSRGFSDYGRQISALCLT